MADDTNIQINLITLLKGLDKTVRGLDSVEKKLKSVANIKVAARPISTAGFDRAAASAQKLIQQQQRLAVSAQEMANRQTKAKQTTDRLAQSQERISQTQGRLALSAQRLAAAQLRQSRASSATLATLNKFQGTLNQVGSSLASVGTALSVGLTAPLVALGVVGVQAAVTLDSLRRGLAAITGSSEEAARQLIRLRDIAKLPGIGFEEAIQGSIRLQAVGFSAADAEQSLIQFANAIALTGGGREELARVTIQLGQLAAKGKVLSQDLRPIIEAAPAVGRALLEAFGTVNSEDIQALGLSSKEFLDTLVGQLGKLPRAAAGAKNSLENFRDSVFIASSAIGDAILPALTKLIQIAEPAILGLAKAFSALPGPIQGTIVVIGGLVAALGPAVFLFGQLAIASSAAIKAFIALNALGLLPTIGNLRLLGQVMLRTASLAAGHAATLAVFATGWGLVALAVIAAGAALIFLAKSERKAVEVNQQNAKATADRVKAAEKELTFLEGLTNQVSLTADQQKLLKQSYDSLSGAAKGRVALVETETEKLKALIEAKKEQLKLDQFAAQATSTQLINNVIIALDKQAEAQRELTRAKKDFDQLQQAAKGGVHTILIGGRVTDVLTEQKEVTLEAAQALERIGETQDEINQAANAILELSKAADINANTLIEQARAAGVNEKELAKVVTAINELIRAQEDSIDPTRRATDVLREQAKALRDLSDAADEAQKSRQGQIQGVIDFLRENTDSLEDAKKGLENYIQLFPELGKAIEKERKGKAIEDFLNEIIGKKQPAKGQSGTSLRNSQEALAKAMADIAEASGERLAVIERLKNDRLLQENENAFKLQLVAYRQYLNRRAQLTSANLQLEIDAQLALIVEAVTERERLLGRAGAKGLPAPERVRAKAGAAEAEQKAIEATTRLLELQEKQKALHVEIKQLTAEALQEQQKDIRQLQIEYGELTGRIEDALNAATDEKFREALQDLALAQDDLNKRLQVARETRDADAQAAIENAQSVNQAHIEAIKNIVTQERALNKLAAAEEFIARAKQAQSDLEQQLAFDVEFRGLTEIEAIKRRLAGEERVKDALLVARGIIQDTIVQLEQLGVKAPQGLIDFVAQTKLAIQGLGELSFVEQFRIAQEEFDRLNDARISKIQDVERAVRNRDIAEIEGRILIKKINGDYVADLESQLALLKQIAAASNDPSLQRQAQQAGEVVKDATDEIADFNTELRATSIDALHDGLSTFFQDLANRTKTAKEALLDLLNSVVSRINQVIADRLSDELIESIFGKGDEKVGILARIKGIFGGDLPNVTPGGAITETGAVRGAASTAAASTLTAGATAASAALTTGGVSAGAALTTGGATAGATLAASIAAAAAGFSAAVIAAGAAFAAAVAASSAVQGASGALGALGGAATGLFPSVPGGLVRIVEGGYPEAVLTTDPKHAVRQARILKEYLAKTKGLFGRFKIPEMASGGWAHEAEMNMLNSIERSPRLQASVPETSFAGDGGSSVNFRNINLFDRRELLGGYLRSAEGAQDILNVISTNAPDIGRRIGVK